MTTQANERIPEWTRGDRLRKARAMTGLGVREFAVQIGVSTSTVTAAELDKHGVRPITIKMWAVATGVPLEWLETGKTPAGPEGPDGGQVDGWALRGLNPEPAGLRHLRSGLHLADARDAA